MYCSATLFSLHPSLQAFRPPGAPQDFLLITTERYKFCILSWDASLPQPIKTVATGNIRDKIGRASDKRTTIIDPHGRVIVLQLYEGMLKILPIGNKSSNYFEQQFFNVRLEQLNVLDIVFLEGVSQATIAVLYKDNKNHKHIKTYELNLREKTLGDGPWSLPNVEHGAESLIPVRNPLGGVIIIGSSTLTYNSGTELKSIPTRATKFESWGLVDKATTGGPRSIIRYLLSDSVGVLSMLVLKYEGSAIQSMDMDVLGETSISSSICYLDNGVLFNGSTFGDSQLLRLTPRKNEETNSFIEVIETYTNLGPILDFCVVDIEGQGQEQVVTCSGSYKDGSLRVVRNGIGINELAAAELPGIKMMWSLRAQSDAAFDTYLVQSFIAETRILRIEGEEMEEAVLDGFDCNSPSLFCGNMAGDILVQVTPGNIRLVKVSDAGSTLITAWTPPAGSKITVATANALQVLIALGGGKVLYFELEGQRLVEKRTASFEYEISCLDMTLAASTSGGAADAMDIVATEPVKAEWAAIGLWTDISARIVKLPSLEQVTKELLGGEIIPRSIMLTAFDNVPYLLVALGDGHLFNFLFNNSTAELTEKKKISLGSQPIHLSTFKSNGKSNVFAASDRPTVIYSSNGKLLFSNVNLKDVTAISPFNGENFPDCLALANEEQLSIGTMDAIQKLHIRTVPLGEEARRIAYSAASRSFCVTTNQCIGDDSGEFVTNHYVRLYDDQTFELLDSFPVEDNEWIYSCIATTFESDPNTYLCIGTAYINEDEHEPSQGRILVFEVVTDNGERKLRLVCEKETAGCVYSLCPFNGKLVAGINSKIQVFSLGEKESSKELVKNGGHHGHILALHVRAIDDFIIVGDLIKSMSVLQYKSIDETIEEIAREYNSNWMTAIHVLNSESFLGAENGSNLFTLRRNVDATNEEERSRLEIDGEFHLGEMVNKFCSGSLMMKSLEACNTSVTPSLIYGTVAGTLGVVAEINRDLYTLLNKLEVALIKLQVGAVGDFDHNEWRNFENTQRRGGHRNFIDGDLIERFLDLTRSQMETVVKLMDVESVTLDSLTKQVEELARCH